RKLMYIDITQRAVGGRVISLMAGVPFVFTSYVTLISLLLICQCVSPKIFHLKEGVLQKEPAANLSEYEAIVVELNLETVFNAVRAKNCTIICGYIEGTQHLQQVTLLSRKRFAEQYPGAVAPYNNGVRLIATKTKDIFHQSAVLFFDFDVNKFTPAHWLNLTPATYIEKLATIFPGLLTVGYVANYGSSAGIYDSNGVELKPPCGFHLYIIVKNPLDIERFVKVLVARLLLADLYWKNDDGKLFTLIDKVAVSPERFCFEVAPELRDGLVRHVPDPEYIVGDVLDTEAFTDLTAAEIKEFEKKFGKANLPAVRNCSQSVTKLTKHDNKLLKKDTLITLTTGEETTPFEFYKSNKPATPCYVPNAIRIDNNPSGLISKHPYIKNVVCLHDFATGITYFCNIDSQEIDQEKPFADVDSTIENFNTLLTFNNISINYDVIKKSININIPGTKFLPDNKDNAVLTSLHSLAISQGFSISENRMSKYIGVIADHYHHNPVKDWIVSKPWDGQDRIKQLTDALITTEKYIIFKLIVFTRWLIGAVASALSIEGNKNEIVLVLCGKQGALKTTFLKALVPEHSGWFKDGMSLDPNNKDNVKQCASHWLVELGELDGTFKRSEIAALKAFLSQMTDELRLPYAATFSNFPRRTAFCATVNTSTFLVDDTGSRRFSTIEVLEIKPHNVDIQQLWAQAYDLYIAGEKWWYTAEEAALQAEINVEHQVADPLEELLTNNFDFNSLPFNGPVLNPTGVLQAIGFKTPNRADATKMGNILKGKGLTKTGKKYQMPRQII
ncbi:MAG: VapE family protein, partial [Methylobacter sp.]|nr:VapE family protein [Methylobacter sp.]MDP3055566.1 VapE family protein [Methylobacter sp.]MDP3363422.1 VapE family protein [Methylobacter sp.]